VRELLVDDGRRPESSTLKMAEYAPDLMGALSEEADQKEADALSGLRLGAWQLLHRICSGGMGAVYLAQRVDGAYEQTAAIKLIRSGWDSQELLQRFRMERQILAQLNHAHIARLRDGGVSDDGKPYLVLECIAGHSITEYCDRQRLELTPRLRLFLVICEAVEYAHQNLVVHRNIGNLNALLGQSAREPEAVQASVWPWLVRHASSSCPDWPDS
jgi:serine/threonine-protein kinase